MRHGSLFSGIGGFDLAAEWMGWENVFHCEWMPFPRKILNYYWPKAISYENICTTDFSVHRGEIDILTGGFPCQPYSTAGKRLGKADERHLFPHMLRAIKEIKPRWVIGENVRGLVSWNGGMVFEEVCADLERECYEVQPFLIPAASVNAPHQRQRIWFVAYYHAKRRKEWREGEGWENSKKNQSWMDNRTERYGNNGNASDSNSEMLEYGYRERTTEKRAKSKERIESFVSAGNWETFPTQSPVCGGNDGLSTELDGITFPKWRTESIRGYGNAVVPQVAYEIFKVIEQLKKSKK